MFVNDFLSESDFKELENLFDNPQFSWYKQTGVSYNKGDSLFSSDGIYFNHLAYRNGKIMSEVFPYVKPIINKLQVNELLRVQFNLYPKTSFIRKKHGWHKDYEFEHKGVILSINTNNGKTITKEKSYKSIRNRAIFFSPHLLHRSTTCTDSDFRGNIIVNYV